MVCVLISNLGLKLQLKLLQRYSNENNGDGSRWCGAMGKKEAEKKNIQKQSSQIIWYSIAISLFDLQGPNHIWHLDGCDKLSHLASRFMGVLMGMLQLPA